MCITFPPQLPQQFSLLAWHVSLPENCHKVPSYFLLALSMALLSLSNPTSYCTQQRLVVFTLKCSQKCTLFCAEIPVGKGNVMDVWRLKDSFPCELGWSRICPCLLSLHLRHNSWPNFLWEVSLKFFFFFLNLMRDVWLQLRKHSSLEMHLAETVPKHQL